LLKGDLSRNLPLNDGDVIRIPKLNIPTYQVEGEVKLPGNKPLPPEGSTRVLEVLSTCGLTDRADRSRIVLMRKGESKPIVIDLDRVLAGDTSANVLVQPGDVLTVASQMAVQVAGEVRTPSGHFLRNGGTLMEAILFAGGFSPDADRSAIEITHHDGTMDKASLVGVTAVVGGPALRPGDLVMVRSGKPQFVTLFGAFRTAGSMRYQNGMTLTDVLISAGLQDNAKWKTIRVLRGDDGPDHKILTFDLEAYLKSPQTRNIVLEPGDRIVVEADHRSGSGGSTLQKLLPMIPLVNLFYRP
jgi:protein involved in polysaccharide export with SLBB domain